MSYTLKDVPTRLLLKCVGEWNFYFERPEEERLHIHSRPSSADTWDVVFATRDELLAELRTRPHVSSTREAKVIRRLMAQTGWSEAQLRAHSRFGQEIAHAQNPNRQIISVKEAKRIAPLLGQKYFQALYKIV